MTLSLHLKKSLSDYVVCLSEDGGHPLPLNASVIEKYNLQGLDSGRYHASDINEAAQIMTDLKAINDNILIKY